MSAERFPSLTITDMELGVNIDHVATLREARRGIDPEPAFAAMICQGAGADSIVVHLREDRRHIKDRDLYILKELVHKKLNLEMSIAPEIIEIACKVKPSQATLVPENRQELTTEGGLDVLHNLRAVRQACLKLQKAGITVSLFIDPEKKQIEAARKAGVKMIELHTGSYAEAKDTGTAQRRLREIKEAVAFALRKGLIVNAGHGLNYSNVKKVARIKGISELNIGYAIICRAVLVGLERAVKEMRLLIE